MNYIEIYSRSPFTAQFAYFDIPEYYGDELFAKHGISPRFFQEGSMSGSPYIIVFCRVKRRDRHKFVAAMNELEKKMIIRGFDNYDKYCEEMFAKIELGVLELTDVDIDVGEYEQLKERVENLNKYLAYIEEHNPELMEEVDEWFDGMPGYEKCGS